MTRLFPYEFVRLERVSHLPLQLHSKIHSGWHVGCCIVLTDASRFRAALRESQPAYFNEAKVPFGLDALYLSRLGCVRHGTRLGGLQLESAAACELNRIAKPERHKRQGQ
jgi:hypothetical protein